jgi:hypothetical protein
MGMMPVSERRVCRVLGQHRSTKRKTPRGADDEAALTEDNIALARQYGRYGHSRVTALLRDAGWRVNRGPHSSLGYRPSTPETATPSWLPSGSTTLHLGTVMVPEAVLH